MKKQNIYVILILAMVLFTSALEGEVIEISLKQAISRSRLDNLSLQVQKIDNKIQDTEVKRAWGSFLPTIDYQGLWQDDESDDATLAMVYPPGSVPENQFIHSLQLTLPIFTGGSRYANLRMQNHQKKSLEAAFKGAEDTTVMQSLQAYYGLILSQSLLEVYQGAQELAEQNLRQVESFKEAGAATELELRQARTRLFETIPQVSAAENQFKLTANQLKFLLNISTEDSLIVSDILELEEFLGNYEQFSLIELQKIAESSRSEITQIDMQHKMTGEQQLIARGQFLPTVALTASSTHLGYSTDMKTSPADFDRYNSVGLAVQLPIFKGGSRYFDLEQASYSRKQTKLLKEQIRDQIALDVEQSYYSYTEAKDQLRSLKEALDASEESLRLAQLYFEQGMINQTDVIGAQLSFIQNATAMKNGIYNYNTSQLALLKAIGDLQKIWQ